MTSAALGHRIAFLPPKCLSAAATMVVDKRGQVTAAGSGEEQILSSRNSRLQEIVSRDEPAHHLVES